MHILSVEDVLQETIENKHVFLNNFEFLVEVGEDDPRNGSDNEIDKPPSVHDRPSCPWLPSSHVPVTPSDENMGTN